MDTINLLPVVFLKARLFVIENELEEMPTFHMGAHRGIPIIREYYSQDGVYKKHEYRLSSKKGQRLLVECEKRKELISRKRHIESSLADSSVSCTIAHDKVRTQLNKEMWERLPAQTLEVDGEIGYVHNGIRMRSRGEVVIAQVLDTLGLEYKYETRIVIDGEEYHPDFAVFLPEFQRFFFIEFLGMMDDRKYSVRNSMKIGTYIGAGMMINEDLLLFSGTMKSMPSVESIREDIIALISKYCRMYTE